MEMKGRKKIAVGMAVLLSMFCLISPVQAKERRGAVEFKSEGEVQEQASAGDISPLQPGNSRHGLVFPGEKNSSLRVPGGKYLNIFILDEDEMKNEPKLEAVSFWTLKKNQKYEIFVNPLYRGFLDDAEEFRPVKSGTIREEGYHTIRLDRPIPLEGSGFWIKLHLPDGEMAVRVDESGVTIAGWISHYYDQETGTYEDMGAKYHAECCFLPVITWDASPEPQALKEAVQYKPGTAFYTGTDLEKRWTVRFSEDLNIQDYPDWDIRLYEEGIYRKLSVSWSAEYDKLWIDPVLPYEKGKSYWLYIGSNMRSVTDKKMKNAVKFRFIAETEQ